MSAAEWHPNWCSPERHPDNRGAHRSESSWVVANTHRVEVGLHQNRGRWAITWIVLRAEARVLMFSPAEAKRLGRVLVRLAEEAWVADVP